MKTYKNLVEVDANRVVTDKLDTINRIKTVKIPTPAERRAQIEARKKKEKLEEVFMWSTTKTDSGSYKWQVHKVEHNKPVTVLHHGETDSRAKAVSIAKKHTATYRNSNLVKENLEEAFTDTKHVVQHIAGAGHFGVQGKDVTIFDKGATATHQGKYFSVKNDGTVTRHATLGHAISSLKEEVMNESLDHLQQSLADKDINSKIENGKLVVHKSNLEKAKSHTKKLGHDIEVKSGLNEGKMLTFKEYLNREITHDDSVTLDESLVLEAVPSRTELMDKVEAHRKFGNNVTSHGVTSSKAHITVVDKEGIKRTYHYTPTGTKVETHGEASGSETSKTTKAPEEKRGRGRPSGSSGSYSRRVAEDLENSDELVLEDYDLEELVNFYESEDVEMLDKDSKTELCNYIDKAKSKTKQTTVKKLTGE